MWFKTGTENHTTQVISTKFDKDFTYLVGTYILYIQALTAKKKQKVDPKYWLEKMQFIDSRGFCNMLEIAYLYFCGNSIKTSAF